MKPRRPRSRPGFTRQPESPNVDIFGPQPSKNTTKIQREDPQEKEEIMKIVAGESKKRAKFWAVRRRAVRGEGLSPPPPPSIFVIVILNPFETKGVLVRSIGVWFQTSFFNFFFKFFFRFSSFSGSPQMEALQRRLQQCACVCVCVVCVVWVRSGTKQNDRMNCL